jgi:Cdc6-like AAA superfamily ATPase
MRPTKPPQGEPKYPPLASILRPKALKDIIGQQHLVGEGAPFHQMAAKNKPISTILWGPPGTGKTSLVSALANEINANFRQLNATNATVKDIRAIIEEALSADKRTMIFVDECLPHNALVWCKIGDSIIQLPIGHIVEKRMECKVLSYDIENKVCEWSEIVGWSVSKPKTMIELTFDSGETIRCSDDHLIYTENRGYIEASKLCSDDIVVSAQKYVQENHNVANSQLP